MANDVQTSVGMGCYEHPDKTVVATCPSCGKFMCKECAEKNPSKLCDSCEAERIAKANQAYENQKAQLKQDAQAYKKDTMKELIKISVISVVLAVIGWSMGSSEGTSTGLTMAWMLAGFPWGWKIINQLMTGNMMTWLLVLTDSFWIVAYVIKFALAFLIGAIAWPIKLGIAIYHVVSAKKTEKEFNETCK